jgi:hypothetical protein
MSYCGLLGDYMPSKNISPSCVICEAMPEIRNNPCSFNAVVVAIAIAVVVRH